MVSLCTTYVWENFSSPFVFFLLSFCYHHQTSSCVRPSVCRDSLDTAFQTPWSWSVSNSPVLFIHLGAWRPGNCLLFVNPIFLSSQLGHIGLFCLAGRFSFNVLEEFDLNGLARRWEGTGRYLNHTHTQTKSGLMKCGEKTKQLFWIIWSGGVCGCEQKKKQETYFLWDFFQQSWDRCWNLDQGKAESGGIQVMSNPKSTNRWMVLSYCGLLTGWLENGGNMLIRENENLIRAGLFSRNN